MPLIQFLFDFARPLTRPINNTPLKPPIKPDLAGIQCAGSVPNRGLWAIYGIEDVREYTRGQVAGPLRVFGY